MKDQRFTPQRSLLVMIDMQQRLMPAIEHGTRLVDQACRLMRAAQLLDIPLTLVEENPAGLGATEERIRQAAPQAPVIVKMAFGAGDEAAVLEEFEKRRAGGRDQLVLAGAEAHVCVLQSALGLAARGYHVGVVSDCIGSRRAHDREVAITRMPGAGVSLLTREMIVFEWLASAAHPQFKAVLDTVR